MSSILDIEEKIKDDTELILKWLENNLSEHCYNHLISHNAIEIKDNIINIHGNVVFKQVALYGKIQEESGNFPDFIKFGIVNGCFDCSSRRMTSLKGAPELVCGTFDCSYNRLKNLKYGPKEVYGGYNAENNKITSILSTHNLPSKLKSLNINYNYRLKSVKGLSDKNIRRLYIRSCKDVKRIDNIKHIPYVYINGSTILENELEMKKYSNIYF